VILIGVPVSQVLSLEKLRLASAPFHSGEAREEIGFDPLFWMPTRLRRVLRSQCQRDFVKALLITVLDASGRTLFAPATLSAISRV